MWWQFLTYGFVHDISGITHLLFNMVGLYVFGRDVELRMGRMEFLRFYLAGGHRGRHRGRDHRSDLRDSLAASSVPAERSLPPQSCSHAIFPIAKSC